MTYQDDFTLPTELLEQIASEGFDVLPELIRQLINTAMQLERQKHLGAGLYQHARTQRLCQWLQAEDGQDASREGHLRCAASTIWRFLSRSV